MAGKHRSVLKENKIIKPLLDDLWFTSTNEKKQNKRQVLIYEHLHAVLEFSYTSS